MTKKKKEIKVPLIRRFLLNRKIDDSKVSGTGFVAAGVMFNSGKVVLEWIVGRHPSLETHNTLQDCMAVHGHGNHTEVIWIDPLEIFITDLQ